MPGPAVQVIVVRNLVPNVTPRMRASVARALNTGVMTTIGYADPLTPVDTGMLRGNKTIVNAAPGSLTASASWNQEYAIYQEMGTSRGVTAKRFAKTGSDRAMPNLIAGLKAVGGELV